LKTITSKQVLYNDRLVHETALLIQRLCDRPKIHYQVSILLGRLLHRKSIVKGADELAKGFLHKNLLYEDFLNQKFKELVLKQLKDEKRRADLVNIIVNFFNSDTFQNLTISQVNSLLRMEITSELVTKNVKEYVHSSLDNPETMKSLKQKVDSYFEPSKSK